jgi:hypothetical protein
MFVPAKLLPVLVCLAVVTARGENSAPSSHFVFDDGFDGDIIINEVRVPGDGDTRCTYYETLGWGGVGAGYAGIQNHPKSHLFIFSIWDNKKHTAPIKAVHLGPGTKAVGFGGEGTGLKSWNFDLGWKVDTWYTLAARSWPVGDHTHYGFWSRAGDTGRWTHLVTMDVAAANGRFRGRTDAFLEDWSRTGANVRVTHLRGGWKRKLDGAWFPFSSGTYSVNKWDLPKGKRSYKYRTSWNGGTARDAGGEYYFMASGGADTKPSVANPSQHAIKRSEVRPDYERLGIADLQAAMKTAGTLSVSWKIAETGAPQFAARIDIHNDRDGRGEPLLTVSRQVPQLRTETLDVSSLPPANGKYFLRLTCTDLFDRESVSGPIQIGGEQ